MKKSPDCGEVWCAPGNGGIGYDAHCVNIKATDVETMVGFAETEKFDYVVVAQDDPLALGMVDALAAVGIPAFGPDKAAARIEASKVFSKDLMKKYGIPTAKYETFDDPAKVMEYIKAEGKYPVVIKADGLALGKGVLICENEEQAAEGVKEIMLDKKFGASGNHVVVEEFLTGPEVSVLSFTDGKVVKPMVSSMDHKRANDHDTGLNTGGMGTVAPNPYYTPAIAAECMEKIFLPTIKAMNAEGCPFKGCLYFGLMLTPDGPKVIEYNCRFGDPETQVVLPLLESDLLKVMTACTEGTLADTEVKFSDGAAACVILASGGYPVAYEKGKPITGLVDGQLPDEPNVTVYHSGTAITEDGQLVTNGGRVLGVTATAPGLPRAISIAYEAAEHIHFDKLHKRTDIGMRALKALAEKAVNLAVCFAGCSLIEESCLPKVTESWQGMLTKLCRHGDSIALTKGLLIAVAGGFAAPGLPSPSICFAMPRCSQGDRNPDFGAASAVIERFSPEQRNRYKEGISQWYIVSMLKRNPASTARPRACAMSSSLCWASRS